MQPCSGSKNPEQSVRGTKPSSPAQSAGIIQTYIPATENHAASVFF